MYPNEPNRYIFGVSLPGAVRLNGISSQDVTGTYTDFVGSVDINTISVLRLNTTGATTFNSMKYSSGFPDESLAVIFAGTIITLINVGSSTLTLKNENASGAAHMRFDLGGSDLVVPVDGSVTLWYDGTAKRWRAWGVNQLVGAMAETNVNDIFRCDNPGGVSAFAGTIATLPGGATLTYNVTSGQEGAMVPVSTSQLAKMRLYNTTRGTSALISNCVTGTNTITFTANVPAGWAITDVITIASQTVSGGGYSWVDLEITSVLTGKSFVFLNLYIVSATVGDEVHTHPFETYGASKLNSYLAQVVNILMGAPIPQQVIANIVAMAWTGTPTRVVLREGAYIK
jgi:hypothetical protein